MQAFNVNLSFPSKHGVTSREETVLVDVTKLSSDILAKLALHGLTQKIADAASSASGDACAKHFGAGWKEVAKADRSAWLATDKGKAEVAEFTRNAMQAAMEVLLSGEWSARGEGGGTAPVDPVANLAHTNAKSDLLAKFKAMTGKRKLADIAATGPSLGKYFVAKGDVVAWHETEVRAYIDRMAESGKRDYMQEAREALEGATEEMDDLI